jgi:mycothiol synthase
MYGNSGSPAGMLVTMSWDTGTAATDIRAASTLIGHALQTAANQGCDRAILQVDSANPFGAFGIYERAGFTPKLRFVRWALDV